MHFATKSRRMQILVWLVWAIACLVFLVMPEQAVMSEGPVAGFPALEGVVTHDARNGPLFPWQPKLRWRQWAWRRYALAHYIVIHEWEISRRTPNLVTILRYARFVGISTDILLDDTLDLPPAENPDRPLTSPTNDVELT